MQNGRPQTQDEKLDKALEDSFPGSDPVSITQPDTRQGAPHHNSQTTAQNIKDAAQSAKETAQDFGKKVADNVNPDYLWLGGAFVLGCIVGLAARSGPFAPKSYGDQLYDQGYRMQKKFRKQASRQFSDMNLQKKLSDLLDRLS